MPRRPSALFMICASLALVPAPSSAQPLALRLTGTALGEPAEIEARDLPRDGGAALLDSAWAALAGAAADLRRLSEQSAGQPFSPGAELLLFLARTRGFCTWSDGAVSALGAPVYRLWNPDSPGAAIPTPEPLESAAAAARCDQMQIEEATGRAELAPGSAFDFRSFARGWAIDQAIAMLRRGGAVNVWARIGGVARGTGAGPSGRGWPFPLPRFANVGEPLGTLLLKDQAVAVADPGERPIRIAGETFASFLDLRTGRPATGVAGVVVATELAVDAEPLATAMVLFGANSGQMRLGTLKPRPSVLWMLGSPQTGAPVIATSNWSAVKKQ